MFRRKTHSAADLKRAVIEALLAPEWLENVLIGTQGDVTLIIRADPDNLSEAESRRLEAESTVRSLAGVVSVNAVLTAERASSPRARPGDRASDKVRHTLIDNR